MLSQQRGVRRGLLTLMETITTTASMKETKNIGSFNELDIIASVNKDVTGTF